MVEVASSVRHKKWLSLTVSHASDGTVRWALVAVLPENRKRWWYYTQQYEVFVNRVFVYY